MKAFLLAAAALCIRASDVITLTYENFEEKTKAVAGDGGVWLVDFFGSNCSHCETVAPYYEEIATELKGKVNVAKVDCKDEANEPLCYRFRVKRLPVFYHIKDGIATMSYPGPHKKRDLISFATDDQRKILKYTEPVPPVVLPEDVLPEPKLPPPHTGPSDVVTLTDENFEHLTQAATGATTGDWLIAFHAPWCQHCLFLAPVLEELATELKDQIVVARVDVTENPFVAKRFNINSYPTVKFFSKGKMIEYKKKGSRTKEDFLTFVRDAAVAEDKEDVPEDFTSIEVIQMWAEGLFQKHLKFAAKRLQLAKRDIDKGKYWSVHTVVVLSVFLAIVMLLLIIFALLSPAKSTFKAQSKKTD